MWSWRRRLPKFHWKWIWTSGMVGLPTCRKQHQLSLRTQTVESCRRPVAKIQVPERVWPGNDAPWGEIPLVGVTPGEWQVSFLAFNTFECSSVGKPSVLVFTMVWDMNIIECYQWAFVEKTVSFNRIYTFHCNMTTIQKTMWIYEIWYTVKFRF